MSGYGSRRRVLVVALMVGALSTGVGFVVLGGWWLPTAATTADVQGTPVPSRVPCVVIANGLPCVASTPGTFTNAAVTTKSADATLSQARSSDHTVAETDLNGPVQLGHGPATDIDLTAKDSDLVQPDRLVARNADNSGSSYPGGTGAAFAGSGAGNGSFGSHAQVRSEAVGLVSGGQGSPASSSTSPTSSSPSTSPSRPSSVGLASSASNGSSDSNASNASSTQTIGAESGKHAVMPDLPLAEAGDVPPVFVEHHTTVSDLTLGRNETGTPISIAASGTGAPMSSTPEPSSMLLIGTGVVGLGAFLKRRRAAGKSPQA